MSGYYWHVKYEIAPVQGLFTADYHIDAAESSDQLRERLQADNPRWKIKVVEMRTKGPGPDDRGPKGKEGTAGS